MNGNALVTLVGIFGIAIATAVIYHDSPSSEPSVENSNTSITSARYIVQADSLEIATQAVEAIGADITHELGIINAVGVTLSSEQFGELSKDSRLRIEEDRKAGVSSYAPSTFYPTLSGAADLHDLGITGHGVTVAVVDSGFWETDEVSEDTSGQQRVLAQYDAIAGTRVQSDDDGEQESTDEFGHGSHITSIILNSETDANGDYVSVAPDVRLVTVRAFDGDGNGTYLDVIRGLDWILNNQVSLNIRVVNLSFSAEPSSFYWDDPINQAVMRLWQEGIVVVASAGNGGPDAMTIGVPGNVPYVITVGAMTDYGTPFYAEDDRLTSFSAAGPTVEGFVKPDLVAPGGRIIGLMDDEDHKIAQEHPEFLFNFDDNDTYFEMSGTSQSAAIVTGVVALMLQAEPSLTPDQLKCKLMRSARPAVTPAGELAYSVFQQGAGLVNANAVASISNEFSLSSELSLSGTSSNYDCANVGMDVGADLAGKIHYGGPANVDEDGNYYVMGLDDTMGTDGYIWTNGYVWTNGFMWTNGYVWTNGYMWTNAYMWTDGSVDANGYMWTNGYVWTNGYMWTNSYMWTNGYMWTNSLTETAGVNHWVNQE